MKRKRIRQQLKSLKSSLSSFAAIASRKSGVLPSNRGETPGLRGAANVNTPVGGEQA
jgi:hypothetical protein